MILEEDDEVVHSDTGLEYINHQHAVFILDNFDGNIFQQLRREKRRIFGLPVVLECARDSKVASSAPVEGRNVKT